MEFDSISNIINIGTRVLFLKVYYYCFILINKFTSTLKTDHTQIFLINDKNNENVPPKYRTKH